MKKTKLLLLIAFYSLISSCKQNGNGNYLIYKTRDRFDALFLASTPSFYPQIDDNIVEDIYAHLRSAFVGKTVNFKFQEDYVQMNFMNSNNFKDIILNRTTGRNNIEFYYGERIVGQISFQYHLMTNNTKFLILAIDCSFKRKDPIIIPTQLGAYKAEPDDIFKSRVIFCLKKIN